MLCHESCHHRDLHLFGFPGSPHARGFYQHAALLYQHCRGTPLRRLLWRGSVRVCWRIDWARMRQIP